LLDLSLRYRSVSIGLALLVFLSLPLLYQLPQRELAPSEDQANILTAIKSPQHANLDYAEHFGRRLDEVYRSIAETESTWIINGTDGPSSSFGGINLSTWTARERP